MNCCKTVPIEVSDTSVMRHVGESAMGKERRDAFVAVKNRQNGVVRAVLGTSAGSTGI